MSKHNLCPDCNTHKKQQSKVINSLPGVRIVDPTIPKLLHTLITKHPIRRLGISTHTRRLANFTILFQLRKVNVGGVGHGVRVGIVPHRTGRFVALRRPGREGRLDDVRTGIDLRHLLWLLLLLRGVEGNEVAICIVDHWHGNWVAVCIK